MTAIALKRAVIAIVQKDDIASPHTAQAVNDLARITRSPVVCLYRPHYNSCAAALLDHRVQLRAAITKWRTHPAGAVAGCRFDGFVATVELARDISRQHKCEPRMRICVIADYVAALRDLLREGGKSAHAASNDEESRAHIVLVEHVSNFSVMAGFGPSSNVSAIADESSVPRMVGPKSCADGATAAHEKPPVAAQATPVARATGSDCMRLTLTNFHEWRRTPAARAARGTSNEWSPVSGIRTLLLIR